MKNLIIFSIGVIVLASFISMQAVNSISQPTTCEDCHAQNFQIPACTDYHVPHKERKDWNNSVCLTYHSIPHISVKGGALSTSASKENFASCHPDPAAQYS